MPTIIIKLYPDKLENPDLDLRYLIPDRIEEYTHGAVTDNGYDYLDKNALGIWLAAETAGESYQSVIELIKNEHFLNNDLSKSAELYISENEAEELENCTRVY